MRVAHSPRSGLTATMLSLLYGCAIALLTPTLAFAQAPREPVIFLDQAWSQGDREWYYQFSQGSSVISYDIFLNLEVAGSQELFRGDANSERFGLIAQPANPRTNPDGLPIGLAKTQVTKALVKDEHAGEYVGLTCAACHNAQLTLSGQAHPHRRRRCQRVRSDGLRLRPRRCDAGDGEGHGKVRPAGRPARRELRRAKEALRKRFEKDAERVHQYRTRVLVAPTVWGPSRMDAISLIVNRVSNVLPGIPENWSTPVAPTKPPFLWNAPQGLWTQWRGVQQVPIERNLIETMGVFMSINLHAKTPAEGCSSRTPPFAICRRSRTCSRALRPRRGRKPYSARSIAKRRRPARTCS